MPVPMIKSFADKSGKTEQEVEKLWKDLRDKYKDNYELIVGTMKKILNIDEAKQVGIIYHFTTMKHIKLLLDKQHQESIGCDILEFISHNDYLSTTRDFAFTDNFDNTFNNKKYNVRIAIDGNKLSEKYKIKPINGLEYANPDIFGTDKNHSRVKHKSEREEVICPLKNKSTFKLKDYIIQIYIRPNSEEEIDYAKSLKDSFANIDIDYGKKLKPLKEDVNLLDEQQYVIEQLDVENNKDTSKGTYVSVKVKNTKQFYDWFTKQGIKVVPEKELHCTISYSRKEFKHIPNKQEVTIKPNQLLKIEELGNDGAIVLKMKSDELQKRFDKCIADGATYDYPSYIPHITITYDGVDIDITKLELPDFDIILSEEIVEELEPDWKDKLEDIKESYLYHYTTLDTLNEMIDGSRIKLFDNIRLTEHCFLSDSLFPGDNDSVLYKVRIAFKKNLLEKSFTITETDTLENAHSNIDDYIDFNTGLDESYSIKNIDITDFIHSISIRPKDSEEIKLVEFLDSKLDVKITSNRKQFGLLENEKLLDKEYLLNIFETMCRLPKSLKINNLKEVTMLEEGISKKVSKAGFTDKFKKWIDDSLGKQSKEKDGSTIYYNKAGKAVFGYNPEKEVLNIFQNGLTFDQLKMYGLNEITEGNEMKILETLDKEVLEKLLAYTKQEGIDEISEEDITLFLETYERIKEESEEECDKDNNDKEGKEEDKEEEEEDELEESMDSIFLKLSSGDKAGFISSIKDLAYRTLAENERFKALSSEMKKYK